MLRVLQLTDTHLQPASREDDPLVDVAAATHCFTGDSTVERAGSVLAAAMTTGGGAPFDLVLHTGDLTETGGEDGCAAGAALLDEVAAPCLVAPGNHDSLPELVAALGDRVAATVRHHDIGRWRVIACNSARHGVHHGMIGDDSLAALDRLLDCDLPVVVACHHPPLSPCGDPACGLVDAWELLELLDRHPNVRAVVSGHLHLADEIERAGVRYLLSPATSLQLRHRHPLPDSNRTATPAGARILHLHDDGTLDTDLVWV